jgi:hypothetical protein
MMHNLSIHIRKHGPPSLLFHKKIRSKAKGLGLAAWAYDLAWTLGHFGLARLSSACPGLAPRSLALELALAPWCVACGSQPTGSEVEAWPRSTHLLACVGLACLFACLSGLLACLLALLLGSWTLDLSSWQLAAGSWQLAAGSWQLAAGSQKPVTCAFCLSR